MDRRRFAAATIASGFASLGGSAPLRAEEPGNRDWGALGDEIAKIVRERFFDRKRAEAWMQRHASYGRQAKNVEDFKRLTKEALATLKASHTGYYIPSDARYYGLAAIFGESLENAPAEWDSPGCDFTRDGVVRHVFFPEAPGSESELRRGDKVLRADGEPFHPVDSFRDRANRLVALAVQRKADSPPITVPIMPRRINAKHEWLASQRTRSKVVSHANKRIAYAPMFSCAGDEHRELLDWFIRSRQQEADALILDFRDGFGGCSPDFLNFLFHAPPVIDQTYSSGSSFRHDTQWRKPIVLLINEGTTSGKEMVAFSVKKHRLGALVGKKTAGAVLAGTCYLLSNRALLCLAVADVLVDGVRLEGRGVEPDVDVPDELLFATGTDRQLEKALDEAARMAKGKPDAR